MRKISGRVKTFRRSPHRLLAAKAEELMREGREVFNFSVGQPGLPPSSDLVKLFCGRAEEDTFNHFRYVSASGMYSLKEAISSDLRRYGGLDIPPENIVITTGGIEAFHYALSITTDPGDEVFLLDPSYSVYWDLLKYLNLKVRRCVQSIDTGFQPDEECIKEKVTEKTAAIIAVSPDNPTSRILREDILKLLADLAEEKDSWLIYDEAYKHIVYEGSHVWIHNYGSTLNRLISINTFSKDIAIPGFRVGYMYAPKEVIVEAAKLKGILSLAAPVPGQWFAYYALTTGIKEKYLKEVLPIYRERRDVAYEAFRKYLPEARVWKPPAGMYLFPDMSAYMNQLGMNDIDFAFRLAEKRAVIMLPGSIFGEAGRNHLRVTFVTQTPERLEKGIRLVAEFINEEKNK